MAYALRNSKIRSVPVAKLLFYQVAGAGLVQDPTITKHLQVYGENGRGDPQPAAVFKGLRGVKMPQPFQKLGIVSPCIRVI